MWSVTDYSKNIQNWGQLRTKLTTFTDDSKILSSVVQFFTQIPTGDRSVDYYDPTTWCTPWEIIYNDMYCDSVVSILAYYTLKLVDYQRPVTLAVVDYSGIEYLTLIIDNELAVDASIGEIVDIKDDNPYRFLKIYDTQDIKQIV